MSIIILNYITWQSTLNCIQELLKINYKYFNIIVVDNNSQNNSLKNIKEKLELKSSIVNENEISNLFLKNQNEKIFFIQCLHNHGYAKGNNIGIRFAELFNPEFILILNNDTLPKVDFLDNMVQTFNYNSKIGLVGAINYNDKNKYDLDSAKRNISWYHVLTIHQSFSFFNKLFKLYLFKNDSQISNLKKKEFIYVEIISGACMLFKTDVLKKIDYFDENTFLFFEENIICEKLKKNNILTALSLKSKIIHKKNFSLKNNTPNQLKNINLKSLIYFLKEYKKYRFLFIYTILLPYHISYLYSIIKNKIKQTYYSLN
ncbi:MAG: glycosyltransferase family 2 protein [Ignavibacteriales bacterium]|nr:glycosyltransferase family 2 protein [Ignavibacteriales bacterium]MCB9260356.1 glycosyltransferase family 2 protein [Ignavibacteriales bacterium]